MARYNCNLGGTWATNAIAPQLMIHYTVSGNNHFLLTLTPGIQLAPRLSKLRDNTNWNSCRRVKDWWCWARPGVRWHGLCSG